MSVLFEPSTGHLRLRKSWHQKNIGMQGNGHSSGSPQSRPRYFQPPLSPVQNWSLSRLMMAASLNVESLPSWKTCSSLRSRQSLTSPSSSFVASTHCPEMDFDLLPPFLLLLMPGQWAKRNGHFSSFLSSSRHQVSSPPQLEFPVQIVGL